MCSSMFFSYFFEAGSLAEPEAHVFSVCRDAVKPRAISVSVPPPHLELGLQACWDPQLAAWMLGCELCPQNGTASVVNCCTIFSVHLNPSVSLSILQFYLDRRRAGREQLTALKAIGRNLGFILLFSYSHQFLEYHPLNVYGPQIPGQLSFRTFASSKP